jgi:hypothetical protein
MALYFVEYELRDKRNYSKIITELESLGAVRVLNSYWCFKRVNTSAKGLREHFKSFIDSDDAIMVTEVTDWAGVRLQGSPNDLKS